MPSHLPQPTPFRKVAKDLFRFCSAVAFLVLMCGGIVWSLKFDLPGSRSLTALYVMGTCGALLILERCWQQLRTNSHGSSERVEFMPPSVGKSYAINIDPTKSLTPF